MNIDKIIKDSVKTISDEFELRRSLFLNVLHMNIDILASKAPEWFKGEVPPEFSQVLNSLMNLSISYFDKNRIFEDIMAEHTYEAFNPEVVINEIKEGINGIVSIQSFNVAAEKNLTINTSHSVLKDSLFFVFLGMSQFVTDETSCFVSLKKEHSRIKFEIYFHNLSDELPELQKLSKVFYSIKTDVGYKVRIGFNIPFENIKRIGGIINIANGNNRKDLVLKVSFPSTGFLQTVDDIRKRDAVQSTIKGDGVIALSFNDRLMEMVLADNLKDMGFSIKTIEPEKIKFIKNEKDCLAVLADYSTYAQNENNFRDDSNFKKLIIIYGNNDNISSLSQYKEIRTIKMPFEVNQIVNLITSQADSK